MSPQQIIIILHIYVFSYDIDGAVCDDGSILERMVVNDAHNALGVDGGVHLQEGEDYECCK